MRDCGRSCADCGLGALARQILFFYWPETALQTPQTPQAPQTPQTPQPLKPLEPGRWFCHTGRSNPLKPLKPLEPCQWFCQTGRWRRSKTSHLLDCGPWALCASRWRRSKTSHLLDCGLWALCETVGGVAQTVGSGLWRAKALVLPYWPLETLGVRSQNLHKKSEPEFAQEMKENERKVFFLGFRGSVWHRKCNQERLAFDQN